MAASKYEEERDEPEEVAAAGNQEAWTSAPQRTAMELAYRKLMILLEGEGRRRGNI